MIIESLILLLVASCLIFLYLYHRFCYNPFQVLKRNGIKGPPPSLFYGNYKERVQEGSFEFLQKFHQKYGPIFGYYLGQQPEVSVMDLELIKLITVKDFDIFVNREIALIDDEGRKAPGLLRARGDVWRSARQTLSPSFSSFKMKAMTPLIQQSVETLVQVFQEHADTDKSLEFFRTFGAFTMESIIATAFGRFIDIQRGESNELTKAAAIRFESITDAKISRLKMLLSNFPCLKCVLKYFVRGSPRQKAFDVLHDTAIKLIQERQKETQTTKYKDLLQLMIDSNIEGSGTRRRLSDEEITSYSTTFLLAGYETTANALSYTAYLLALHPDIQEKLQTEIDKYYQENKDVSLYQATQDLEYLDLVVQESLRLYPPAPIFPRHCSRDYSYNGITIPKGSIVIFPSFLLHKDPQYWQEPEEFDPLRFTAEEKAKRPQLCYMPFGNGPRNCIGMRFALLEAKMALIELLKKFTFVKAADTEVPLKTVIGITMAPKNGIYLKVVIRK